MAVVRVACLECKRSFPIQLDEPVFTCPRCGRKRRLIASHTGLAWTDELGSQQTEEQDARPLGELLSAATLPGYQRSAGAARSRHLLRQQQKPRRRWRVMPLTTGLIVLMLIAAWGLIHPEIEADTAAESDSVISPTQILTTRQASSPTFYETDPPLPTSTWLPTATPSPLPPSLVQATAWQSTIDAAAAASHLQQTADASRYQATQTAISARFTAVASSRQFTPTCTIQAKEKP